VCLKIRFFFKKIIAHSSVSVTLELHEVRYWVRNVTVLNGMTMRADDQLAVCLGTHLSICLSFCLPRCRPMYISLSACLSPSVHPPNYPLLSFCLPTYLPTYRPAYLPPILKFLRWDLVKSKKSSPTTANRRVQNLT